MNKRPGHVDVTVETGYCSFCGRTRNLRREEHHLGALVRTIVTCETCHRTLSSSIGVAQVEPAAAEEPADMPAPAVEAAPAAAKRAAPKATPKEAAPVKKAAAKKAPVKKTPVKSAGTRTGKPTSTTTRKVTRRK
jgi:hypothetical protein